MCTNFYSSKSSMNTKTARCRSYPQCRTNPDFPCDALALYDVLYVFLRVFRSRAPATQDAMSRSINIAYL